MINGQNLGAKAWAGAADWKAGRKKGRLNCLWFVFHSSFLFVWVDKE